MFSEDFLLNIDFKNELKLIFIKEINEMSLEINRTYVTFFMKMNWIKFENFTQLMSL